MKFKTPLIFFVTLLLTISTFYFELGLGTTTIFILTALVLLAAYLDSGDQLFSSIGFQKKKFNAKNLLLLAPITALILLLIYRYLLYPVVVKFTGIPVDISAFDVLRGNLPVLLGTLAYVWTSAAFGEEIVFRGYLMTRFSKVFGTSTFSIVANIILFGAFFGVIHAYQGVTGQILNGLVGAMIATLFHLKKNDLWFCVVVHGMFDTIALTAVYLGIF